MSLIKSFLFRRFLLAILGVGLLASCGGSDSNGPSPLPKVAVPNVVGLTQTAATSSITGAGLTVGTVTMASSATVASGSVVSQTPAAATMVASASAVNLTVSSGPAQVAVPNVVGMTQAAATTSITGAGLILGTVTMTSSATVPSGSVISQSPAAAATVAAGSTVNLTVSSGGAASAGGFAYVSNVLDGTISAYSVDSSTGALTALAGSPVAVGGSGTELSEIKFDPSGKFLYVLGGSVVNNVFSSGVYGYVVNPSNGSLTAVPGSPFATGNDGTGAISLVFDASGTHLYTANSFDNNGVLIGSVSAYSLDPSTGALTPLANSPYAIASPSAPVQMVRAGNYLYVVDNGANAVAVFAIAANTGALTQNVPGAPFATDLGPYSIVVNPSGSLLYTANSGAIPPGQFSGPGSLSGFSINSSTGVLTPIAGSPLPISISNDMAIDPQGKYLFTTANTNGVSVYPINATTGALGTIVAGSPFAAGNNPFSISIDKTGQFVYVGNDASANISEFTLDSTTGVLTPITGSPVAAGTTPDFIAVEY